MLFKRCILIVILIACILMTGCNLKEKIGKNITEKTVDNALGDDANVDLNNGDVTVKGDDGSEVSIGDNTKWPKGQAADYIPKFEGGVVTYALNAEQTCMIMVSNITDNDYKKYLDAIIAAGYNNEKIESNAVDMQIYSAKSTDGVVVSVSYLNEEKALNITVDASAKQ